MMDHRMLLCAYYFPPIGSPQSFRWLQFVKYLSQHGWKVDILTIEASPFAGQYDPALAAQIPAEVTVFRTSPGLLKPWVDRFTGQNAFRSLANCSPHDEVHGAKKKIMPRAYMKSLAGHLYKLLVRYVMIPGEAVEWLPFALWRGKELVRSMDYDVIVSSGYPFVSHLVAFMLKHWSSKPWAADYGDPWSFNPFASNLPKWRQRLERKLESLLLQSVDRVIVTTVETKMGYIHHFPEFQADRVTVVTYGYDREQFDRIATSVQPMFRVVYTGVFYERLREPFAFLDAVKDLPSADVEIKVAGPVHPALRKYIEERELGVISFLGHIPHQEALRLQKNAALLMLMGNESQFQLPSKFFEYLGARRPILAIKGCDTDIAARLVSHLNRGFVVDNNPQEIARAVRQAYSLWKQGRLDNEFCLEELPEFTWESSGAKVHDLLMEVVGDNGFHTIIEDRSNWELSC